MYTLRRLCILAAAICCLASDCFAQSGAPDTVAFAGQRHRSFGGAKLSRIDSTLRVTTGINGSGVVADLYQSDGYCLMFMPTDTIASGARLEIASIGRKRFGGIDTLETFIEEKRGDSIYLRYRPGACRSEYIIQALVDDSLVATIRVPMPAAGQIDDILSGLRRCHPFERRNSPRHECRHQPKGIWRPTPSDTSGSGDIWIGYGAMDVPRDGVSMLTLRDGRKVMANVIRIVPLRPVEDDIEYISNVVVRTSGMQRVTIAGELLYSFDRQHKALGEVDLLASGGTLRVSGRDTSKFGVQANYCDASSFGFQLETPVASQIPDGARLVFDASGRTGGGPVRRVGSLTVESRGDQYAMSVDLSAGGSPTNRIEILAKGELVTAVSGQSGVSVLVGKFIWPFFNKLLRRPRCYRATYPEPIAVTIPGRGTFQGDEIRLLSENPADTIAGTYSWASIVAERWPSFTITSEMEARTPIAGAPVLFAGLRHEPYDATGLTRSDSGLRLTPGISGGSASIRLGESDGHCLMLAPISLPDGSPARLEVATLGRRSGGAPDTLAAITAIGTGTDVTVKFSPQLLRMPYRVEAYNGNTLVGTVRRGVTRPGGSDTIFRTIVWPRWLEFRHRVDRCAKWRIAPRPTDAGDLGDLWIGLGAADDTSAGAAAVTLSDGRQVTANLIRLIPEVLVGDSIDWISNEVIRFSGMPGLTIEGERLYSFGRLHAALGEPELDAFDRKLRVTGSDTSSHGVQAEYCNASSFGFELDTTQTTPLPVGAKLVITAVGSAGGGPNRPVGTMTIEKRNVEYALSVDLSAGGSPTNRVEIFNKGQLVTATTGQTGVSALSPRPRWFDKLFGRPRCYRGRFASTVPITIPGKGTFQGDEIRLLSENPGDSIPGTYSSASIVAERWPSFTILDETETRQTALGDSILFAGLWHAPFGSAKLARAESFLRMTESSTGSGFKTELGQSHGYCLMLDPISPDDAPARMEVATVGRRGVREDTLYTIIADRNGGRITISYRSGLVRSAYDIEAYIGTRYVGTVRKPQPGPGDNDTIVHLLSWPRWLESRHANATRCWDQHRFFATPTPTDTGDNGDVWIGIGNPELPEDGGALVTLTDGRQVTANVIRIVPAGAPGGRIDWISKHVLRANGIPSLTIAGELLYAFKRQHKAIGEARLKTTGNWLQVAGPALSRYGVRANLSYASSFDFELEDTMTLQTVPRGARMVVETEGFVEGGPYRGLGTMTIEAGDSAFLYSVDLRAIGSATNVVEIYSGGQLVRRVSGKTGVSAATARLPRVIRKRPGGGGAGNPSCYTASFTAQAPITIPGSGTFVGDEIRMLSENVLDTAHVVYSAVSLSVEKWPYFVIVNESETLDSLVSSVRDEFFEEVRTANRSIELSAARPNPVSSRSMITVRLATAEPSIWLTLSDINGREIARLIDGRSLDAGEYRFELDVDGLPNGMYYYTLRTPGGVTSRTLQVMR